MPRKTPPKRRKNPPRKSRPPLRQRLWSLGWRLGLVLLVVLAGWMVYLDAVVTSRFEGQRFEVPSRVYARPLELYDGASISADALRQELELAGYRSGDGRRPGTWHRSGSRFVISTRGFGFVDGPEPGRRISLAVSGNQVTGLRVLEGEASPIVRLEPAEIGGIYPAHREDRVLVSLEDAPPLFEEALLTTEDRNFYDHFGIAPVSIARAMVANIKAGRVVQGGSTLTQQLVKNFYLTRDQTLIRKGNEALMSVLLEWHYDKTDILEAYLNEVYLGQAGSRSINGFGLASQFYFRKGFQDLELHESALLVAMV
ncbi:MAG: transglycosylase domain-containing protein, partial [Marinobacter sp.]